MTRNRVINQVINTNTRACVLSSVLSRMRVSFTTVSTRANNDRFSDRKPGGDGIGWNDVGSFGSRERNNSINSKNSNSGNKNRKMTTTISTAAASLIDDVVLKVKSMSENEKRVVMRRIFPTVTSTDFKEEGARIEDRTDEVFKEFDINKDEYLSKEEFRNYQRSSSSSFIWQQRRGGGGVSVDSSSKEEHDGGGRNTLAKYEQLKSVFLSQMYPFIGFGFLDNSLMLVFGESIEASVGLRLGVTSMACAAIGNTLSDVCGVGLANKIEYLCTKFGLTDEAELTKSQAKQTRVVIARLGGAMTGVTIGCIVGSFPLLFH